MIIGVTGMLGAGKGAIVEYLVSKKGFAHYSARDFIVKEAAKRGLTINRDTMTAVANDLRENFGPGYIVQQLIERALNEGGDAVIESVRTLGEIDILKSHAGTLLFGVNANPKIRYERIKKRGSETDNVDYEKFLSDEAREDNNTDPTKANLSRCLQLSDVVFDNSGTIEELYAKVETALSSIH